MSEHSVTLLVEALKEGAEGDPQEQIVCRFLRRLEAVARTRLGNGIYEDGEDVAMCALKSFLERVPCDEFSFVTDRESLWRLLVTITLNKACSSLRRQYAAKRGGGRHVSLQDLAEAEPSILFESFLFEANRLLDSLVDPLCREIARCRMEGLSNQETALKIHRSEKTVERKLKLIRKILRAEFSNA